MLVKKIKPEEHASIQKTMVSGQGKQVKTGAFCEAALIKQLLKNLMKHWDISLTFHQISKRFLV